MRILEKVMFNTSSNNVLRLFSPASSLNQPHSSVCKQMKILFRADVLPIVITQLHWLLNSSDHHRTWLFSLGSCSGWIFGNIWWDIHCHFIPLRLHVVLSYKMILTSPPHLYIFISNKINIRVMGSYENEGFAML